MSAIIKYNYSKVLESIELYGKMAKDLKARNKTFPELDFRIYTALSRGYRAYCKDQFELATSKRHPTYLGDSAMLLELAEITLNETRVGRADLLMAILGWTGQTRDYTQ